MGRQALGWSIEHLYLVFLYFNLSQAGNTNDSNMTDSGGFVKVATDEEQKRMDPEAYGSSSAKQRERSLKHAKRQKQRGKKSQERRGAEAS
jgi:hypothetical protein